MSVTDLKGIPIHPLWQDTSREPPLRARAAQGRVEADVVVVGGGYTGLSCGLHLATEYGRQVVLVEALCVGAGASGVNGGQVIPGLKHDPERLEKLFPQAGPVLVDLFGRGADLVFSLIERHTIQCAPQRSGWILAAHSPRALSTVRKRCAEWQERGAVVEVLSEDEMARETGSDLYPGGFIDRRAGTVQPLAYARGLARAFADAGGTVFENSPATGIRRSGGSWYVSGEHFELAARHVVIATDAYSGTLLPSLPRSLLTVNSLQIATEPLSGTPDLRILGSGACLSEARKVAVYIRRDPEGRLLIGGRGPVGEGTQDRLFQDLQARLSSIFARWAPFRVTHRWHGRVALTLDELPHLHEPEHGLLVGCGYNGRGIAAATTMGKLIASCIAGEGDVLPRTELSGIPWHALRQPLLSAGVHYYRLRDRVGFGS